jgi:hypothetical protein
MNGLMHTEDAGILDQYPKYYPFPLINCTTFRFRTLYQFSIIGTAAIIMSDLYRAVCTDLRFGIYYPAACIHHTHVNRCFIFAFQFQCEEGGAWVWHHRYFQFFFCYRYFCFCCCFGFRVAVCMVVWLCSIPQFVDGCLHNRNCSRSPYCLCCPVILL